LRRLRTGAAGAAARGAAARGLGGGLGLGGADRRALILGGRDDHLGQAGLDLVARRLDAVLTRFAGLLLTRLLVALAVAALLVAALVAVALALAIAVAVAALVTALVIAVLLVTALTVTLVVAVAIAALVVALAMLALVGMALAVALMVAVAVLAPVTALVIAVAAHAALIVVVAAALALAFGHLTVRLAQHAGVMLRMLEKALFRHAVMGQLGVTRQRQVFLDDLLGGATHLALGPRAIEDAIGDIPQRALAVRFATRAGF